MQFKPATDDDCDTLMSWFDSATALTRWGGPVFRFPFSRTSFRADLRMDTVASYTLRDDNDEMQAFGQVYERWGRMNIARLVVAPGQRGGGAGRQLLVCLMQEARRLLALQEFSLFVYRDNVAATALYRSLGFTVSTCPSPEPKLADCDYMIRSCT